MPGWPTATWRAPGSWVGVRTDFPAWEDRTTDEDSDEVEAMRNEAISHAVYHIIRHRFHLSPRASRIRTDADALMGFLGFDRTNESIDWENDDPAAIGNHIAGCYIDFGMTDGSNEENDYANLAYEPVNPALEPHQPGNPDIVDLNRWQPLALRDLCRPSWKSIHDESTGFPVARVGERLALLA